MPPTWQRRSRAVLERRTLMKTEKTCPVCGELKAATAFGTRQNGGRPYLRSHCRDCIAARQRTFRATPAGKEAVRRDNHGRRADPEVYARQLEQRRNRYHTDVGFRESQLAKSRAVLSETRDRVRRVTRLLEYFEGRQGWLRVLAASVCASPNAMSMQLLSPRIDGLCAEYLQL